MSNRSPKFLLVEERLGEDLASYLLERRPDATYERLARELWVATKVDVTAQTVANWCERLSPTDVTEAAS